MLPIGCPSNKVYNLLLEWIKECNVKNVAVEFDNSKNIIHIYAEHPGVLIGKAGVTAHKYLDKILQESHCQNYDVKFHSIGMIVSCNDEPVSDEQYFKDLNDYFSDRFNNSDIMDCDI